MRLFRDLVLVMFMFICANNMAKAQSITYTCTYQNGTKTEYIGTSTLQTSVTASKTFNGLKYTFVITDTNNFSEVDDYVVIENDKGHKITYPLSCSK